MSDIQQAYAELIEVAQNFQSTLASRDDLTDAEIADGYRNATDLLSVALDCYIQNDPSNPHWVQLVSPHRKFGGDNQHARYYFVPLSGRHRYRISGDLGGSIYMGFTVYGIGDDDSYHIVHNTNNTEFPCNPDGSFVLEVGDGVAVEQGFALSPETDCLVVRQYFSTAAVNCEPPLKIEVLDPVDARSPVSSTEMTRRLKIAASFLRGWSNLTPMPWPQDPAAYNQICEPLQASASTGHWSTPDNIHAFGYFSLEADQALILRGKAPSSLYWSCHLWTASMRTFDFENYQCARSGQQIQVDADGSWQLIVANHPAHDTNWLDTGNHQRGFVYFRWLMSAVTPSAIECELVALSDLLT